jgi:long-chain acyl-CoA synthetase
LLKINAIVSPLSPDLTPFELKVIFDNLNPHAVIALSKSIEKAFKETSTILDGRIIVLHDHINHGSKIKKYYEFNDLYNMRLSYTFDNINTNLAHVATINYTYRGLGYPLGAMLTYNNYVEGVSAYIENTSMSSHHRVLSLLPLSHVYPLVGCMLAPLISGATIIITRNYMPRSIFKVIDNFQVNHLTTVPSIYDVLFLNHKNVEYDLSSLTCCITGGAYMSPEMIAAIKTKMGIEIFQGYGLTECLPVTWNRYEYNKTGTLGLPLRRDFQVKIVGDNGVLKEVNEVGEIVINSPTVMQGYYNRKEETREVLKDGYLYTGDYGYLDEKGYLYFAGLKKNVAKVGGNMVDLKEVKDVLLSHPWIADAFVYSEKDELWGHIVAAEVVSRTNGELTESDIKSFCSKRLSRYKVAKKIKFKTEVAQR